MDLTVGILPYRKSASGIATYTLELANALASKEVNVYLIGFETKNLNLSPNIEVIDLGKDPTKLEFLAFGPLFAYYIISKKLHKVVEEQKLSHEIDVFHFPLPAAAMKFKGKNIITTSWGHLTLSYMLFKTQKFFSFPKKFIVPFGFLQYSIADQIGYKKSQRIICVTTKVLQKLQNKYSEQAVYIPPGIIMSNNLDECKKDSNISILFISRDLELPKKNIITLLKSIKLLARNEIKSFSVTLVGKHSQRMKKMTDKIGIKIRLMPYIPRLELSELYRTADIFVCTSLYEEFGYVLLEAMSYGLPIVASDIPSFRDMIIDRKNGFLVQAKDPVACANALEKLIESHDLRMKMGRESYEIVKAKFDWNNLVKKYIKTYESTLV